MEYYDWVIDESAEGVIIMGVKATNHTFDTSFEKFFGVSNIFLYANQ